MYVEVHATGVVAGGCLCVCGFLVEELQHLLFDHLGTTELIRGYAVGGGNYGGVNCQRIVYECAHYLLYSVVVIRREIWGVFCLLCHLWCFIYVTGGLPLVGRVMWSSGVRVLGFLECVSHISRH